MDADHKTAPIDAIFPSSHRVLRPIIAILRAVPEMARWGRLYPPKIASIMPIAEGDFQHSLPEKS